MRLVRKHAVWLLGIGGLAAGCASAPPKPAASSLTAEQKMAWILQLEDQRILRVEPPPAPPVTGKSRARQAPPPLLPDLVRLVADPEPRIRRRAALAIGRVHLSEGRTALESTLADSDPEVRAMAAFALGLIGDKAAVSPLTTALQDADVRVRGRAAEALGLIGDPSAAAPIGTMAAALVHQGALTAVGPDDQEAKTPEAETVRLALYALVRLKAWEPLASVALDASGGPASSWWPVAYALQRVGDRRALPALQQLARQGQGQFTTAFAVRGLGTLKDQASVPQLAQLLSRAKGNAALAATAVRALAQIGTHDAAAAVLPLLSADSTDPNVLLEAVDALGAMKSTDALPYIQDLVLDHWPTMRAAAIRAAARIDPEGFVITLSGMDADPHWIVRSALADALAALPAEVAVPRLTPLLHDQDRRVVPAALGSLVKLKAEGIDRTALELLKDPDFAVRAAAAEAVGTLRPAGGAAALRGAYTAGQGDATYAARAAALTALARYGAPDATETLRAALADKDWALRLHAADLLRELDPAAGDLAAAIRPVPNGPVAPYTSPDLINPPYSPHVFIETAKGTIEIELAVLDAPQTCQNFIALARKGFFNGLQIHRVVPNFVVQDGDPRGDGSGGPGYTIRDELNERPYLRGTVGMALEWADTGGSQFFITHSPQPHLDAKYTAFGTVVQGMDVVDRLQQLDTIERVRVWDGKEMR
jgi:cyclophilin family peptidyl-prolyl cis-trans isomerase/HEAT repeat protein